MGADVRPSVLPSVRPSHFVSGAEHKNRERYLNQTWYIDRSSGELVPFDSLGFLIKVEVQYIFKHYVGYRVL